ncbi:MAG: sporulation protein YqfD [Tyzzerella sp.]|nr:sporulation protein YqfD [Tyzzerella sp.]
MFTSLFRYIQGYLKVRVTGYSPERFLNLCKNKKIDVWGLEARQNAYDMYIRISGFRKLKPILKKTQTKVTIEGRYGMPFFFHKYRKRKLFFAGIILCVILIYSFTFFVWDIHLQGNLTITNNVLLEYLESKNISHGMLKAKVDCEQISKDIRKNFDDIIWVSTSVQGTRLFIHVKENTDTFEMTEEQNEPSDIVADKDGVIKSIVTRNGVPQVVAGDEVKTGDLLVSGTVDVLNDAKEVVAHRYVMSDADILIERIVQYEDKILKKYDKKQYTNKKRHLFFLKTGEHEFVLGWRKNSFENFEVQTKESRLKLNENFYLPFVVGRKSILEYEFTKSEYSKEEMETLLTNNYKRFCTELEEHDAVILDSNFNITEDNNGLFASATITLLEEVGINRKIVDFQSPPVVE